jgi:tetratricopeptide (TPR) repeat protein
MRLGSIRFWFLALVVAAVTAVAPDLGKSGSAAAQIAPAPGSSRIGSPQANSTGAPGNTQTQQGTPAPVFFFGRVIADDGSRLDGAAAVETVCNGDERIEAYTDSQGRFNFQFGAHNTGVLQDASIPGGMGNPFSGRSQTPGGEFSLQATLANCELQARVPGYLSDSVRLSVDEPNIGTILVHRLGAVEGKFVSVTTMAAPKNARRAFERGKDDLERNKLEDARKSFEKAVTLYPDYAAAWQELGKLQFAAKQNEQARRSFNAAIQADPKFLGPYLGLAAIQANEGDWKGVRESTDNTLKLDPYDYPQAYYLNAVASLNLQDLTAAEKNARQAEKLDPHGRFPGIRRLLSVILLKRHEYPEAADQMRGYLKLAPNSPEADQVRAQLSQIENSSADRSREPGN